MIEIELKARVANPAALAQKITAYAVYQGSFDKRDDYWLSPSGASENAKAFQIRVRRQHADRDTAIASFKKKKRRAGIEINDEREFAIDPASIFEEFLKNLGFRVWISKRKRGEAWRDGRTLIELAEVVGLGHFVELEILEEEDSAETVETARAELLASLRRIGLSEGDIENRYYTELLSSSDLTSAFRVHAPPQ